MNFLRSPSILSALENARIELSASHLQLLRAGSLLGYLNLVQRRIYIRFRVEQLRQRNLRQRMVDNLVQLNNYGPDSAIACVHARRHYTSVTLAVRIGALSVQNAYYLVQVNL